MTAVVIPGDGGISISEPTFCKKKQTKSITSMRKIDLLSLFFFDPLHPSFDDIYTQKSKVPLTTESLDQPLQTSSSTSSSSSSSSSTSSSQEISSDENTDPADISLDDSLHDEVDTSSNTTDCEPAWCGCTTPCNCDYYNDEWDEEFTYEPRSKWDDMILTAQEVRSFEIADEWEGKHRTKTQRSGMQLRPKDTEKKDKLRPKRYVNSLCYRKQQANDAALSDHFERQKNKNLNRNYTSYNSHSSHSYESAEVQRAIALSLSTPQPSRNNNLLPCGLSQRQLNDLMNRELTPEDYELLLRLDEGVAKKTVEKSSLDKFASRAATAQDVDESACTICLSEYVIGETLKILPCGHFFHEACVREWLSKSSVNCPIDNLPVDSS